jgi:flagellar motility protein MotE (MotC chaperone)
MKRQRPRFPRRFIGTMILAATVLVAVKVGDLGVRIAFGASSENGEATEESAAAESQAEEAVATEAEATAAEKAATEEASTEATEGSTTEAAMTEAAAAGVEPEKVHLDQLTPDDLTILQQLADRRAELDARARDLDTREQALLVVQRRVEDRITELKALQAELEAMVISRDEVQEEQLKSLVKIYENMKPKDAAPIFDTLDPAILLDVIERMKEAKVAPILALMNPDRAREVTQDLARRRELPPPDAQTN